MPAGEQRLSLTFLSCVEMLDILHHSIRRAGIDHLETFSRLLYPSLMQDEPAGTLRNPTEQCQEQRRRNSLDPQHQPPGIFARQADQVIGQIGNDDAEHDIKLEQTYQLSPPPRRRDLGDVYRRGNGRGAHPKTTYKTKEQKSVPVERAGCSNRG